VRDVEGRRASYFPLVSAESGWLAAHRLEGLPCLFMQSASMWLLLLLLPGCATHTLSWRGTVEWPEDDNRVKTIVPLTEAAASVAAAAAIREMVSTNPHRGLFWGCTSPAQGLDVAVFTGPTKGLYYVLLEQRFHRCGGPSGRVLDWYYLYAVTPEGEVVARADPSPATEDSGPPAAQAPAPEPSPPAEAMPPPASQPSNGRSAVSGTIRWPENLAPMAALEGPAIVAAHSALRHVLTQKLYPAECESSPEAFKITVGYQEPLYYVRIDARAERCNHVVPGIEPQPGWSGVYAFVPGGGMVAPNPVLP
jgi:hypothetical protein